MCVGSQAERARRASPRDGGREGREALIDLPGWQFLVCLLFGWFRPVAPDAIQPTPKVRVRTENGEHCQLPLLPSIGWEATHVL